jgi:hypothetical protein
MSKLAKMQRFVPSVYRPTSNTNIKGLLEAWATEDDLIVSSIADTKEQIYVATAQLEYLDSLAANVGVFRPKYLNLSDTLFRLLVPALSYYPKQVVPTIYRVLEIFFGDDNPDILVTEISPNEVNIQIPYAVSAFRRSLIGSCHLSGYCGTITSIDDANKNIVVQFYQDRYVSRSIVVDALIGMSFSQGGFTEEILDNTVSTAGAVTLHFSTGADLTRYTSNKQFIVINSDYPGSHISNPNAEFTMTSYRGILGQSIVAGSTHTTLTMTDASSIPNDRGNLVIGFGKTNEEADIGYLGRPDNRILLIESHMFEKDHEIGEVVSVVVQPYLDPRPNGSDYSAYLVDVEYARLLAQEIVETLVAAGIVVNWTVVQPQINR